MGIKQVILWMWKGKIRKGKTISPEEHQESVKIRKLNKEIEFYDELLDKKDTMIKQLNDELTSYRSENQTERYIQMGAKLFGVDLNHTTPKPVQTIETTLHTRGSLTM